MGSVASFRVPGSHFQGPGCQGPVSQGAGSQSARSQGPGSQSPDFRVCLLKYVQKSPGVDL